MKCFINFGNDYIGRPNFICILERWLPKTCEPIETLKNGVLLLDYINSSMPPNVDSMNCVLDTRNVTSD